MAKKNWSDLSPNAQKGIVVAGVAEVVLTTIALRDLKRRPTAQVRGPKALWVALCAVQPVGPIAYLLAGRR